METNNQEQLDNLNSALLKLINPHSQKSFEEEERIINIELKNDQQIIKYKATDFDYKQKREFESSIKKSLEASFNVDNMILIPVGSSATKAAGEAQAGQTENSANQNANLKVGHGTVGEKKKIEGVKHVIAIGSGKGGVGKSTVTLNLAIALKEAGYKVGIIDADIYGPSFPTLFGNHDAQVKAKDGKIIPLEKNGLSLLSFGHFIKENDPVIWRGPMLGGVLDQFFFQAIWDGFDYVLIDLPPGTGDIQLSLAQKTFVDAAIVVSTPQDLSLADCKRAVSMFQKLNIPLLGMVENMSYFICDSCDKQHFIFGEGGVEKACSELSLNFLGKIPFDTESRKSGDSGSFYLETIKDENSPLLKSYLTLKDHLLEFLTPKEGTQKKGFFSNFFKL